MLRDAFKNHAPNALLHDDDLLPDDMRAPLVCDCGRVYDWTSFPPPGHRYEGRIAPRLCAPAVSPCAVCKPAKDAAEELQALHDRQRWAQVGIKDRPYRWDRCEVQGQSQTRDGRWVDEPVADFAARVRAYGVPTIGVLRRNIGAAKDIAAWTPHCGHSIYIYGRPGAGKTLYASALATRLLKRPPMERREWTLEQLAKRYGGKMDRAILATRDVYYASAPSWSVLLCPHGDLVDRVKLGWERDRAPLAKVTDADALILDDLGEEGFDPLAKKRPPPEAIESVQRLIRRRYAVRQSLVITSNIPFNDVTANGRVVKSGVRAWFGERVYSRLAEMTAGHRYDLGGFDWRTA